MLEIKVNEFTRRLFMIFLRESPNMNVFQPNMISEDVENNLKMILP